MKLILEFDDFNPNPEVDCIKEIKELVRLFPKIKLTMFTPALYNNTPLYSNPAWCDEVRQLIEKDNLRLAIHGCYHTTEEFKNKDYDDAMRTIVRAESIFRVAKLPFIRCFRGPHWGINQATYDALKWLEYTHVYTHEDYHALAISNPNVKNIYYNWNLKDEIDTRLPHIVIGHGHTHNVCGNGIQTCLEKIANVMRNYDPQCIFADEI